MADTKKEKQEMTAEEKEKLEAFKKFAVEAIPEVKASTPVGGWGDALPEIPGLRLRLMRADSKNLARHKASRGLIPVNQTAPKAIRDAVGLREGDDVARVGGMVVGVTTEENAQRYAEKCRRIHERRIGESIEGVTDDPKLAHGKATVTEGGKRRVFPFGGKTGG